MILSIYICWLSFLSAYHVALACGVWSMWSVKYLFYNLNSDPSSNAYVLVNRAQKYLLTLTFFEVFITLVEYFAVVSLPSSLRSFHASIFFRGRPHGEIYCLVDPLGLKKFSYFFYLPWSSYTFWGLALYSIYTDFLVHSYPWLYYHFFFPTRRGYSISRYFLPCQVKMVNHRPSIWRCL